MADENFRDSPQWRWSWASFCGNDSFQIWSQQYHDLDLCFQYLCLDIPVLAVLACASAFYFGRRDGFVNRESCQIICLNMRCLLTFLLAFLPLVQFYAFLYKTDEFVPKIAYMLSAIQGLAWLSHFLYVWGLRKKLGKSCRGPTVMCVIWSLLFVLCIISLRSHYNIYKHTFSPTFSVNLAYGMSLCYVIIQLAYALTLIPGEGNTTYLNFADSYTSINENQPLLNNAYQRFVEEGDPTYLGVAMEYIKWYSKLSFHWVGPLMEKGVKGQLRNSEDLYDLPASMNCTAVTNELNRALDKEITKTNNISDSADTPSTSTLSDPILIRDVDPKNQNFILLKALHHCFWLEFYTVGILRLVADCSGFAGPILLNKLISYIEDKSEDISWGYLYAFGLMSTTLIYAFCDSQFNFLMSLVGLRMRSAMVGIIYRKTLSTNIALLNSEFSVGEIVNFMSTDTDRIVNACPSFHSLWSIPFQLAVTLYLLYTQVGLAFMAGVLFSVILIPINRAIANKIGQLSTKLMDEKDDRVKLITEVLRGIKAIKLYVWEDHFIRQISKKRTQELKYLKGRKYLDALCVYFWATTPVIISILTFGTYVLMGNKLTAATVFTTIALLNMLISPLNAFPWVLNGMTEAWVSVKRIQKLLQLPDLDLRCYYTLTEDEIYDIYIKNGEFHWEKQLTHDEKVKLHGTRKKSSSKGKGGSKKGVVQKRVAFEDTCREDNKFVLRNINLKVKKGEFLGIIGPVGSGKSTLLSAILAEISMTMGEISISQIESGFAYVTQQPWLQRGTIRENILFGRPFDESKYKNALFACGLMEDVNCLPAGDMTGIGEAGTTLSGGQKARIALARAVYQDKNVYLLDDILSAVDIKVAKHIFQHCIMGLLRNKTRILCTHLIQYLAFADRIVLMEDGYIKKQGKPAEVLNEIDNSLAIDLELNESSQSSTSSSLLESVKSIILDNDSPKSTTLEKEHKQTGNLDFGVCFSYWKAIGQLMGCAILLSLILMQTSRNMTDWWLAHWVTNAQSNSTHSENVTFLILRSNNSDVNDINSYLKVYVEFAAINTLFTLIRAFLFAYGGVIAAAKFHKLLLKSVLKAKSSFFDVTPVGRILNRFSSDTYTVDDSLPFILNILLAQFFGLLGTLAITVYGLPWICIFLVPLIPVYHWLQSYYRLTSRELKRITSVTLSPVYSNFNETLQGLATISAMRAKQRFKRDNEDNVDSNIKAQLASQVAARWLGLRLQFIGVAIVTGVSFIAVVQHQYDFADPGLVGLAISYALTVTSSLSGVVSAFTETEREMIAVERVNQYIKEIPLESTYFVADPPFGWPNQSVISLNNVVLKYRNDLAPSLDGVTFETRPCEKVGVVGRTGAGKSSLIAALFRMVDITSGDILIDTVNIYQVSIPALRSRLFCIPQDPFLFSGSIRENLDPLSEFKDDEMWKALCKVNLETTIKNLGGLDNRVDGGGVNFSVGQKQLICLARAVLHNAKILCIDEATANVDQETDRQIQQTLRLAFRKSTVITIAHRVQTILDSDRVLVMNEGRVVEFDTPDNLLSDTTSQFYHLVNHEAM